MFSKTVHVPVRKALRQLAQLSALALLVAAPAGVATAIDHSHEARNFDARIASSLEAAVSPSAAQL